MAEHRRQRTVQAAVLLALAVLGVVVALGARPWPTRSAPEAGLVAPAPATRPAAVPPTPPTTRARPPTTSAASAARTPATRALVLGADGLGMVAFGTGEQETLGVLEPRLGAPDERGAWKGATPFGTCPGPVRAVRWRRLYVLFTSGPTRYEPGGRWHLFAYQVDAIQRTKLDPGYSGPTPPPQPPPLRGASPRTAAGIGFGATLAGLRQAYGRRLLVTHGEPGMVYRFQVSFGAAGDLSGTLSGGRPGATVTAIKAGAVCGE
jgi:hypothetical protein